MHQKLRFILIGIAFMLALILLYSYFQQSFKDPLLVSKKFAYFFMSEQKERMKTWSGNPELNKEIETQNFKDLPHNLWSFDSDYDELRLVSFQRVGPIIVCTYAYDLTFCYTLALVLQETNISMKRFKQVLFKLPLLGGWFYRILPYKSEQNAKWIVLDCYTEDDFISAREKNLKDINRIINGSKKMTKREKRKKMAQALEEFKKIDFKNFLSEIEQGKNAFLTKWLDVELVKQNQAIKALLKDYREFYFENLGK